ncbi:MAG: glycoside hydrolase family 2 protein [Gammaproteobacteria bacterium]
MKLISIAITVALWFTIFPANAQGFTDTNIPLPEHPRPDFERENWVNLNGEWRFRFDAQNVGVKQKWFQKGLQQSQEIVVPFPWGSPLSGVEDTADIAWYERAIKAPADWKGQRVFLVIGASDWRTSVWFDGHKLGEHQGGYTPFEFELTQHLKPGQAQRLVIRVDDTPHSYKLEGKQGYGEAKGIWQTPYLEARGDAPLKAIHYSPDIENDAVSVTAYLHEPAPANLNLRLHFETGNVDAVSQRITKGAEKVTFEVPIADPQLWSLDDPFLYEVEATVGGQGIDADQVDTYFGMRSISVVNLPGTDYPYIALNGEPVYLELALDQAYHPDGFYTFPTDQFIRDEVLRAKQIGLNGLRVHIKVPIPRKLYWADKLGMLIMADVPNSWGEPDPRMFREHEFAMRGMIARDYNHPSIFSWIVFNETWGLKHDPEGEKEYRPETQQRVVKAYKIAKSLDATRLVEDNSTCCGYGHTETDINSWHKYLAGYEVAPHLNNVVNKSHPGSGFNFEEGYRQGNQPLINSEFGNVWGYDGSTGDVDYSWDYHIFINEFRKRPEIAGWLYTELTDVINEWNGYWRFDRSNKETGLGELVDGMSLKDLHAPLYVIVGDEMSAEVSAGEKVSVPLWGSFLTGSRAYGDELVLDSELYGWDTLGRKEIYETTSQRIPYRPWMTGKLDPLTVRMPDEPGVAILATELKNAAGNVLHRNFTSFVVEGNPPRETQAANGEPERIVRSDPAAFSHAEWSLKQWNVLDGLKVNGAGSGFFEYTIPWPSDVDRGDVEAATFIVEASAKQLFGKDQASAGQIEGAWMRGEGTFDPSLNRNAYPMTDETLFPSAVTVSFNGTVADQVQLADDPADHRGILSWHSQLQDQYLREAGSYGQLVSVAIPPAALEEAADTGELVVRLEVDEALPGGLAIYGKDFGRYPLDPTVVFALKE